MSPMIFISDLIDSFLISSVDKEVREHPAASFYFQKGFVSWSMSELRGIQQQVADYYGIPIDFLEGGEFPPHELSILDDMFRQQLGKDDPELWRKYLVQKAKFILDPTKGRLVHGNPFKYI